MSYDDIVAALPGLNPDQLGDLRNRVVALLSLVAQPAGQREEDWLLAGFVAELKRRGLIVEGDEYITPQTPGGYKNSSKIVRQHLIDCAGQHLSKVQLLALGRQCGRILANWLHDAGAPLTLNVMCRNVHNVAYALDQAFPGYLEAGALSVIVREL